MATGRMIINIPSPKVFIYLNDDALLLCLLYSKYVYCESKKEVEEYNVKKTFKLSCIHRKMEQHHDLCTQVYKLHDIISFSSTFYCSQL